MAFPCNQFLMQEPGSCERIAKTAEGYNVKFFMMNKVNVNGSGTLFFIRFQLFFLTYTLSHTETHPVYRFLKSASDREQVDWNFAKYLVNRAGVVRHFKSGVDPDDLAPHIEAMLNE